MPLVSMRNYVGVGPRGNSAVSGRRPQFSWNLSPDGLAEAEQNVFAAIEIATARFHIAERRVFLGGYQCGGTAALQIALQNPARFAGALTIGGTFPRSLRPLARINAARAVPLLIAQGRDSQRYSTDALCYDLRLCHAAGLSVSVRHYPTGDELTTQMLHDIDLWMMEIVTGIPTGPQHPPVTPVDSN
jgi:phospholipase/carboxylesterase